MWELTLIAASIISAGVPQTIEAVDTSNPYQSLDDRARDEKTVESIQALLREIVARTLFGGDLAPSLLLRVTRSEKCTESCQRITEDDVAAAVNMLGKELDARNFTGTNVQQVRLLRVALFGDLPHLLRSPTHAPEGKIFGSDMTPAGAFFLALMLLRQKISNPAWFSDPDKQNAEWMSKPMTRPSQVHDKSGISPELPQVTKVRLALATGVTSDDGRLVRTFNKFLDLLRIQEVPKK